MDDVSFEINSGEIVGLLGPNGAGKSVIMKILTGFLRPLRVGGTRRAEYLVSDIGSQAKIGYLPENNALRRDDGFRLSWVYW